MSAAAARAVGAPRASRRRGDRPRSGGDANVKVAQAHADAAGVPVRYRAETIEDVVAAVSASTSSAPWRWSSTSPTCRPSCAPPVRAVKPGGLFFAATINRTMRSFALAIVGRNTSSAGCRRAPTTGTSSSPPTSCASRRGGRPVGHRHDRRRVQPAHHPLERRPRHGGELHDRGRETAPLTRQPDPPPLVCARDAARRRVHAGKNSHAVGEALAGLRPASRRPPCHAEFEGAPRDPGDDPAFTDGRRCRPASPRRGQALAAACLERDPGRHRRPGAARGGCRQPDAEQPIVHAIAWDLDPTSDAWPRVRWRAPDPTARSRRSAGTRSSSRLPAARPADRPRPAPLPVPGLRAEPAPRPRGTPGRGALLEAMHGHVLAKGALTGTYERA